MWKYLAIFAVFFIGLAVSGSGSPEDGGRQQQQQRQSSPPPSLPIPDNSSRHTDTDRSAEKTPESHAGIEWANWALVVVGLLTFIAVWMQARESAKATQVMRGSIKLQEKAMEQWIVLDNWRSEIITTSGWVYPDGTPRHKLRILVDIVNPSTAPLTLTEATIIFHLPINSPSTWGGPKDHFLTPNAPYTVNVPLDISAGLVESFNDGIVAFRIEGKFIHVGSLKRSLTQDMSGMIVCSKSATRFESEMPMHPKEHAPSNQSQSQNPN